MTTLATVAAPVTPPSPQDVVANARNLIPKLRERIFETEELRQLPQATIDDAAQAGIFSLMLPASLGGSAGSVADASAVMRLLAQGDPTAAWTLGFLMVHNFLLARYPEEAQAEVFVDGRPALMAGVANPPGRAEPVDGGYRLTGRWGYCSGVMHADWVEMAAVIDGEAAPSIFLARRDEVQVLDTWHMSGMKGSGSHDIVAEDVFVPTRRALNFAVQCSRHNPGAALHPEPVYSYDGRDLVQLIGSSILLGTAEAVVEGYRDRMEKRRAPFSPTLVADTEIGQVRYARAVADLRASRVVLKSIVDTIIDENAASDEEFSAELRAQLKLDGLTTIRLSRQAVETAIGGSGSSIYKSGDVTQHYQRDMYTLLGHLTIDEDGMQSRAGQILLGRNTDPAATFIFV